MTKSERQEWEEEVEHQRFLRNLKLTVEERLDQGTINPMRPGMDDEPGVKGRAFKTMNDYKRWCQKLPSWLGYGYTMSDEPPAFLSEPDSDDE